MRRLAILVQERRSRIDAGNFDGWSGNVSKRPPQPGRPALLRLFVFRTRRGRFGGHQHPCGGQAGHEGENKKVSEHRAAWDGAAMIRLTTIESLGHSTSLGQRIVRDYE